jgi:hypothetical protein
MNFKLIIISLTTILIAVTGFGQRDSIVVDDVFYNYVNYYPNGEVHRLGNYDSSKKRKVKEGKWIIYNKEALIVEEGVFKKDLKEGFWIEVDKNGLWRGDYNKGKKEGSWWNGDTIQIVYKKGKEVNIKHINWGK